MMKRLMVLLLLLLTLSGCAARDSGPAPLSETQPAPPEPTALLSPEGAAEAQTTGALKEYILHESSPTGLYPMGEHFLLLAEGKTGSELLVLEGTEPAITHRLRLSHFMEPEDGFLQTFPWGASYYDPMTLQTVVLDTELRELRRIHVPQDLTGIPLLSADGRTLYYCTADSLRALEPETGISRVLKECTAFHQTALALHHNDSVLQCLMTEETGAETTLFLSTENGQLLASLPSTCDLQVFEEQFYLVHEGRFRFGQGEGAELKPEEAENCFFLPQSAQAVCLRTVAEGTELTCYDLNSGRKTASAAVPGEVTAIVPKGPYLFLIAGESLWRWNPEETPAEDSEVYITFLSGSGSGAEAQQAGAVLAQRIWQRFGLEILTEDISRFAVECELPSPEELQNHLAGLEAQLSAFPEEYLTTLASHFGGIRLIPVRTIGKGETAGLRIWEENTACIFLTPDSRELYRQMALLAETVILTKSNAYDRWKDLNPSDFLYTAVPSQTDGQYLRPETRYFTERRAMLSPAEDRASLFAHAMAAGQEGYFQNDAMQAKLLQLCLGIREGFSLETAPALPWEQYLHTPLA